MKILAFLPLMLWGVLYWPLTFYLFFKLAGMTDKEIEKLSGVKRREKEEEMHKVWEKFPVDGVWAFYFLGIILWLILGFIIIKMVS